MSADYSANAFPPVSTAAVIDAAKAQGRAALIGYLPVGFPDFAASVEAAVTLGQNGFDIIELGIPYSDPVMDGPIIQEAAAAALAGGFSIQQAFAAAKEINEKSGAKVLFMTYCNPVLQYGYERFFADLAVVGASGVIIPDIIPENAAALLAAAGQADRVFIASPLSDDQRLKLIIENSQGFVYAASLLGVTGQRETISASGQVLTKRLKDLGAARVCVGIGITTHEHIAQAAQYADGVIIGSTLVRLLRDAGVGALREFANGAVEAIKKGR